MTCLPGWWWWRIDDNTASLGDVQSHCSSWGGEKSSHFSEGNLLPRFVHVFPTHSYICQLLAACVPSGGRQSVSIGNIITKLLNLWYAMIPSLHQVSKCPSSACRQSSSWKHLVGDELFIDFPSTWKILLAELSRGFCLKKICTLGEESSASKGGRKAKMGSWSSSVKLEASYSRTFWQICGYVGKTFYWCSRETWRWMFGLTGFWKRIATFLLDSPSEPSTNNILFCMGNCRRW